MIDQSSSRGKRQPPKRLRDAIRRFAALSDAERCLFMATLADLPPFAVANYRILPPAEAEMQIRHRNALLAMHQQAMEMLREIGNRDWRRTRRPEDPENDERLRQRHDEQNKSYEQIAREEDMEREAVRSAVRRARDRKKP